MGQEGICLFGMAVATLEDGSVEEDWDMVSIFRGGEMEEDRGGNGRVKAMVAILERIGWLVAGIPGATDC